MNNELIRELVEALEYSSDFLSMSASRFDDVMETLAKACAYLETGGWTPVEDGLPVVPDGDNDVEIWIVFPSGLVDRGLWLDVDTEFDAGITHWRYTEPTPEPPKG